MTSGRRKQMVEVTALHLVDGTVAPLKISLKDGRSFEVETFHNPTSTTSQPTLYRCPVQISTSYVVSAGRKACGGLSAAITARADNPQQLNML